MRVGEDPLNKAHVARCLTELVTKRSNCRDRDTGSEGKLLTGNQQVVGFESDCRLPRKSRDLNAAKNSAWTLLGHF
jgi:hypothetical protein